MLLRFRGLLSLQDKITYLDLHKKEPKGSGFASDLFVALSSEAWSLKLGTYITVKETESHGEMKLCSVSALHPT